MDTARSERDVSRLLCRVLVVVGGAVATTVAAWLISSASASADTLPTQPTDPVTAAVGHPLSAVGVPETVATPSVPVALRHTPAQVAAHVTSALRGAVGQLGHHVPNPVSVPVPTSRPTSTAPTHAVRRGHTRHVAPRIAVPHHSAPVHVVSHHTYTPPAVVPSHRPATPAKHRPTTPWNPVPAPVPPAGSGVGAPGTGGLVPAAESAVPAVPGLGLVAVVPASTPLGSASAGRRPGSTPD
ncbi:MAG TPA: hypothetical protein VHV49_21775 [Pseudonocardiaceae bacterium]|nr:hypothetical protein [Pseudonocardiaceae bacterium]